MYLRCRSGRCHWRIDTALRTHFVVFDDIHCQLSTHVHEFPRYGITTVSQRTPLCPIPNAKLAGFLSTTTRSRRASIHWFLTTLRVVRIFSFQRLRALSCVRCRCTLCLPSNNCFLRTGCTSNVFLSLALTLPTQCSLLPWNVAEGSETSCCIRQGTLEACRLFSPSIRLVGSQAFPRHTSCRNSSYLRLQARTYWEYASNSRQYVVRSR